MTTQSRTTTRKQLRTVRDGDRVAAFRRAQEQVLDRYGVSAESRFVDVVAIGGQVHVLVAGSGPPLVMVIGGTIPAAFWAPLMERLPGRTLYAMDLPGFGLTDSVDYRPETYRETAVAFLSGVLDGLGLGRSQFVTQSIGAQWTHWLAQEHPGRVDAQVMVGCPAFFLDTSAPLPMRLGSVPGLGRLLLSMPPSPKQVESTMRMVGEDAHGIDEVCSLLLACERLPAYAESLLGMMRSEMSWTRARPAVVTGTEELKRVDRPVQLIWGEKDAFGRLEAGRRVADAIPGARFATVPGGHAPWLHHAEQVGTITRDFLRAEHPQPESR